MSADRRILRARISAAALTHNLAVIQRAAPASRMIAVIKANAYGHGVLQAAVALASADAFAVARIEEAVELRSAGIAHPIILLEGVFSAEQLQLAARLNLELVVHDYSQIQWLEHGIAAHRFVIWVKIDTGMNRLGFRPSDANEVWRRLAALASPPFELRLMTHLACADEPQAMLNEQQLTKFREVCAGIARIAGKQPQTSIGSSAGIFSGRELQGDWVRPGIALYGASPFARRAASELGLLPAMTLESTVIAVREIAAGESVGYGATWRATRASRIAIVAVGYADGIPRNLPNGAPVLINGQRAAVAGRVSMDMLAVDVTEHEAIEVGAPAVLWGEGLPVEEVARAAGTISYELLSRLARRVPLEYF